MSDNNFGVDHHTTAPADDADGRGECDDCGERYERMPGLKCDTGLCPSCRGGDVS